VRLLALSPDPYQRGRFKVAGDGSVVSGYASGIVEESANSKIPKGQLFFAFLPFSSFVVVSSADITNGKWTDLSAYCTIDTIHLGVSCLGMVKQITFIDSEIYDILNNSHSPAPLLGVVSFPCYDQNKEKFCL
jgi:hypothetical protein